MDRTTGGLKVVCLYGHVSVSSLFASSVVWISKLLYDPAAGIRALSSTLVLKKAPTIVMQLHGSVTFSFHLELKLPIELKQSDRNSN